MGLESNRSYPRWVGALLSLFLPGLGQYLSGRKKAAVVCFFLQAIYIAAVFFIYLSSWLLIPISTCRILLYLIQIPIALDAYRKPIPRFGIWGWLKVWGTIIAVYCIFFFSFLLAKQFLFQLFKTPTDSMKPTLIKGDHFAVEKVSFYFRDPYRGELVVIKRDDKLVIKRIVGLPGEKISIHPPYIYINGEKLVKPKIFEKIGGRLDGFTGYTLGLPDTNLKAVLSKETDEIVLKEDEYFCLSDNSPVTTDSRYYGPVKKQDIKARVMKIYSPDDRIGVPE